MNRAPVTADRIDRHDLLCALRATGVAGASSELTGISCQPIGIGHTADTLRVELRWSRPGSGPASLVAYPRLPHVVRDSWCLDDEDLLARCNHRALQFVRITSSDGDIGHGVVDQCVSLATATARAASVPPLPGPPLSSPPGSRA